MKVAGFTFVRNALRYDYPIVEAITSMLPLCDYLVVAVGQSDDATLELVRTIIDPRIHIIETVWDDTLRAGGKVLAVETDKAFAAIPADYDWCIYLQGDECLHEQDFPAIRAGMERWLNDPQTQGFLFHYRHFYGSYDYIGVSRRWYRREIRIIRNDKQIHSYRDAQGFRYFPGTYQRVEEGGAKLRVRLLQACIHHYGWVKNPAEQQRKQLNFNRLWHSDAVVQEKVGEAETYQYDGSEPLERYTGTHPAVLLPRIQAMNWQFSSDPTHIRWRWKDRWSNWLERHTGWRVGEYRNYVLVGDA